MGETLGPIEAAVWKVSLQKNRETICTELKCKEFCRRLYEKLLLTVSEHERLQKREQNEGVSAQCCLLLDIFGQKSSVDLQKIVEELKLYNQDIYKVIERTVRRIADGSLQLKTEYDQDPSRMAVSLATILLEEAEQTVRQRLKKEICDSSFSTISNILKEKEEVIRQCRDGSDGRTQTILKSQFRKLFPNGKAITSLENLDLTLITALYKVLFNPCQREGWHILPNDDDSSLHGHLDRLHFIRNWCYANLLKPKQTKRKIYSLLEKALFGLGAKKARRYKWFCVMLYPDMEIKESLTDSMKSWIKTDLTDIHGTLEVLKILSNSQQIDEKEELDRKVKNLQSQFRGNHEKIFTILKSLPVDFLHSALLHLEKLEPESQVLPHQIQSSMAEMSSEIQTKLEETAMELKEHMDSKIESTKCQNEVTIKGHFSRLTDEVDKIVTSSEVFKVLVLSQPFERDHEDLDQLCLALGNVNWDVMIDLDYRARTDDGLHERIVVVLKRKKDYQIVSYRDTQMITDTDEDLIAKGQKTLWLLANGCADTDIKPLSKSSKVKALSPVELLLSSILSKLQGRKSLACFNIILGDCDNVPGISKDVLKRIDTCCSDCEEFIDIANSKFYSMNIREEDKSLIPEVSLPHEKTCLTHLDVATLLSKDLYSNTETKTYIYPGEKKECHVTAEKMAKYQAYILLYHRDIGEINFKNKSETEIEDLMEQERALFLRGLPLTPRAQNIQSRCQVFVVRKEMEKARQSVADTLKDREEWDKMRPSGHFTIRHDSSAGGTTTARYLLYSLRNDYPCIEVRRVDRETTEFLEKLFQESKKPLLIVLDHHEFSAKIADEFQQELFNEYVKALVVYVARTPVAGFKQAGSSLQQDDDLLAGHCETKDNRNSIYIPSKLQPEDKIGFKQLYQNLDKKKPIGAARVILYGLLAFCDDYDRGRLNEHISEWFETSTDKQKNALGVVILTWKYCQKPIKVSLLDAKIAESNHEVLWEKLFGFYGSDFVKTDEPDSYSACPVHTCIIGPILEKLEQSLPGGDKRSGTLKWFATSVYSMFSQSDVNIEDVARTTKDLFIERPTGAFMSAFVTDMKEICGIEFPAEQILKFALLFKHHKHEGHMRALYARYLAYEMDKLEEALIEITKAVGLEKGQQILSKHSTNEPAILATYGHLQRNKALSVFNGSIKENPDRALQRSIPYFIEAIDAFEKSQMTSMDNKRYTVVPFLGEVKVRLRLLELCFVHFCKKRHEVFRNFLKETPYDVIKNSEENAMAVLETVAHLDRLNKLEELSVNTSREIVLVKFRLLKFHFDGQKTKQQLIESVNVKNDSPFDIGLLIRLHYDKIQSVGDDNFGNRLKNWSELRDEELKTIINFVQRKLEQQSRVLASNFADILSAMIQIRYNDFSGSRGGEGSYDNYNLDYAMLCATQWGKLFPKDQRALFHLGALKLVKGLEEDNIQTIEEGVALLNKTDEICKENPYARDLKARTYAIGEGRGLSKLVPYKKDMPRNDLQIFDGRQINSRSLVIGVHPYQKLLRAKMYGEDSSHIDDGQQSKLKFCICLRQKFPIVAFNIEKV